MDPIGLKNAGATAAADVRGAVDDIGSQVAPQVGAEARSVADRLAGDVISVIRDALRQVNGTALPVALKLSLTLEASLTGTIGPLTLPDLTVDLTKTLPDVGSAAL